MQIVVITRQIIDIIIISDHSDIYAIFAEAVPQGIHAGFKHCQSVRLRILQDDLEPAAPKTPNRWAKAHR